eukprot:TRINITY_DN7996_c0_g1_i1.p1 TRINITY_DN7996_c0_g1~~TRINITY_DN7996_c0_g1_i1.p1  ORF type:complete len:767 (+),score=208.61 TRINITY_DN7996_c0_g1_i1:97-2301(+)
MAPKLSPEFDGALHTFGAERITRSGGTKRCIVAIGRQTPQHLCTCDEEGHIQRLVPLLSAHRLRYSEGADGTHQIVLLLSDLPPLHEGEPDLALRVVDARRVSDLIQRIRAQHGLSTDVRKVEHPAAKLADRRGESKSMRKSTKVKVSALVREQAERERAMLLERQQAELMARQQTALPPSGSEQPPEYPEHQEKQPDTPPGSNHPTTNPSSGAPSAPPPILIEASGFAAGRRLLIRHRGTGYGVAADRAAGVLVVRPGAGDVFVCTAGSELRHEASARYVATAPAGDGGEGKQVGLAARGARWHHTDEGMLVEVDGGGRDCHLVARPVQGGPAGHPLRTADVGAPGDPIDNLIFEYISAPEPERAPEPPPQPLSRRTSACPPEPADTDPRRLPWLTEGFRDFFRTHDTAKLQREPQAAEIAASEAVRIGCAAAYRQMLQRYPNCPLGDLEWLRCPPPLESPPGPPPVPADGAAPRGELPRAELQALRREIQQLAQVITADICSSRRGPPAAQRSLSAALRSPPPVPSPPLRPAARRGELQSPLPHSLLLLARGPAEAQAPPRLCPCSPTSPPPAAPCKQDPSQRRDLSPPRRVLPGAGESGGGAAAGAPAAGSADTGPPGGLPQQDAERLRVLGRDARLQRFPSPDAPGELRAMQEQLQALQLLVAAASPHRTPSPAPAPCQTPSPVPGASPQRASLPRLSPRPPGRELRSAPPADQPVFREPAGVPEGQSAL